MNDVVITDQAYAFVMSLAFGALLCLVYDILRTLHRYVCRSRVWIFLLDVFFWVVATLATLFILIIFCKGYLRAYVFAGEIIGFVIFRLSLSPAVIFLLGVLCRAAARIFSTVSKPFRFAFGKIGDFLTASFSDIGRFYARIRPQFKKREKILAKDAKNT